MTRPLVLKTVAVLVPAALILGVAASVTVQEGETLPGVAERALGDAGAASELRALNALDADVVPAGTVLKLPGPDRSLAVSAVAAARNAVNQADAGSARKAEAAAQLKQAEALLGEARYKEAAAAADGAWRLVSGRGGEKTKFTVDVAADGKTEVTSTGGQPVRVEAQGVVEPVYPGDSVRVAKGQAPQRTEVQQTAVRTVAPDAPPKARALGAPQPLSPPHQQTVLAAAQKRGVGPVSFRWKPVEGARGYELVIAPASGKPLTLKVRRPQARLSALAEGSYTWTVRALGEGASSPLSERRSFELRSDGLKLEVKGTDWE